jgi:PAS domain S-box-containing protein
MPDRYRVLVVEDDAATALIIKEMLGRLGYEVVAVASTAADATQLAKAGQPHVVLMDISLPGEMTGIQAGDWIRQNLDIPVVFVTAYSDESTLCQAQATEPYGFILKPVDKNDLRIAIELALTKHRIDVRLRWSQRRFATTLKAIGDAVISTDANGTIDFVNDAAVALIGIPASEALARPLATVVKLVDPQSRQPLRFDQHWKNAAVLLTAFGQEVPVAGSIANISSDKDEVAGQVLVLRDITEERRLVELRERQRAEKVMTEASDAERRRFGQELHDGLGQMLTGIAFLCKRLEDNLAGRSQPEAADVREICKLLRDTMECTREIARGLLPVPARPDGLVLALERFADQITSQFRIACNFSGAPSVLISDPAVANHLFRIAQEAVNNAVKHARPNRIDIDLQTADHTGHLSIRDNGRGFSSTLKRGNGIDIMRHRASAIGGALEIFEQSPGGAVVKCEFPVGV